MFHPFTYPSIIHCLGHNTKMPWLYGRPPAGIAELQPYEDPERINAFRRRMDYKNFRLNRYGPSRRKLAKLAMYGDADQRAMASAQIQNRWQDGYVGRGLYGRRRRFMRRRRYRPRRRFMRRRFRRYRGRGGYLASLTNELSRAGRHMTTRRQRS